METFDVEGPVRVTVENPAGEVKVATGDAPRAEVEVRALRDDEASRDAVANTRVELRDGELVVEVPHRRGSFLIGRDPQVLVDVRVPHDSALAFATASADVAARGRYGEVRGKTASGDVTLTDAASVSLEAASGDLRVDEVRGSARLRTASGDVAIGHAAGRIEAAVVSGDLRVRSADEGGAVQAVSGDIELGAVARGDVEVRSVSGDVSVGVPAGVRVHVDVSTVSGDLDSDFALTATPVESDGPVVSIKGRTVSGDLRVRRALTA